MPLPIADDDKSVQRISLDSLYLEFPGGKSFELSVHDIPGKRAEKLRTSTSEFTDSCGHYIYEFPKKSELLDSLFKHPG
jgi:hypothetical protein